MPESDLKESDTSRSTGIVTADIKYHDFFTEHENFLLVDVGHYESEFPIVEELKTELADAFEELTVMATSTITNPMKIYISDTEPQSIHQS